MLPSFDNVWSELKLYFSDLTTALLNVWVPVFDLTSYILRNMSVTKSKPTPAKECKFYVKLQDFWYLKVVILTSTFSKNREQGHGGLYYVSKEEK